ncbi:hypothetical protein VTN02DRAFT_6112 [Thermoascus thermophilus]
MWLLSIGISSVALLWQLAHALPPPEHYADGSFLFPNGHPEVFEEGTPMNVSWQTVYNNSNVYLIHGSSFNNPQSIVINTAATWYEWQIAVSPQFMNRSMPFVFRVVNAQGTNEEQMDGGFLSAGFFIPWNQASVGLSTSSSSSSSSSSTITQTTLSSAQAPTPKPTTADSSSTSPAAAATAAAATSTAAEGTRTSHNSLGLGLGVGLGVPLVIALAAVFYFLRGSRGKAAAAAATAGSTAFVEIKDPTMSGYTSYFRGELEGDHAPRYELQSERRSTVRFELG